MGKRILDINCDVGEGIGNEARLFPFISSCNIACGGHAGDPETMRAIVLLAKKHRLKLGAHPSYPDREHFGRVTVDMPGPQFCHSIREQLSTLQQIAKEEKASLHHIKAHGALYNDLAGDVALAGRYLECLEPYRTRCALYAPYGSEIARAAAGRGFRVIFEAFGDRRYATASRLASRKLPGAVINDPEQVLDQLLLMYQDRKVQTLEAGEQPIEAATFCIHGDTPAALQILAYLAAELPQYGIYLKE